MKRKQLTTLNYFQMDNIRASHISPADLRKHFTLMISEMFHASSQSISEVNVEFMVKELIKDINERFPYFDLCEIKLACSSGLRGEYGDYKGINIVSINQWIRAYNDSEQRRKYVKDKIDSQPALTEKATMTDQEIFNFMRAACLKAFEGFKEGIYIEDYGNAKYKWLDSQGVIKFTNERKYEMLKDAEEDVRKELVEQMRLTPNKRATYEAVLNNPAGSDYQDKLIGKARYRALMLFFGELRETGIELNEMI